MWQSNSKLDEWSFRDSSLQAVSVATFLVMYRIGERLLLVSICRKNLKYSHNDVEKPMWLVERDTKYDIWVN